MLLFSCKRNKNVHISKRKHNFIVKNFEKILRTVQKIAFKLNFFENHMNLIVEFNQNWDIADFFEKKLERNLTWKGKNLIRTSNLERNGFFYMFERVGV